MMLSSLNPSMRPALMPSVRLGAGHVHGPNCYHDHDDEPSSQPTTSAKPDHIHGPHCNHSHDHELSAPHGPTPSPLSDTFTVTPKPTTPDTHHHGPDHTHGHSHDNAPAAHKQEASADHPQGHEHGHAATPLEAPSIAKTPSTPFLKAPDNTAQRLHDREHPPKTDKPPNWLGGLIQGVGHWIQSFFTGLWDIVKSVFGKGPGKP